MRIQGNERADELATSSKHLVPTTSQIQFQDIKPLVNSSVFQLWQLAWSLECENKLYVIKPALGMWESASHRTRRHEVLLCRPRIGSSYLTHKHLLRGETPPLCYECGRAFNYFTYFVAVLRAWARTTNIFPRVFFTPDSFLPSTANWWESVWLCHKLFKKNQRPTGSLNLTLPL